MDSNIIHVDFRKPNSRRVQKADAAARNGQVEKAVELYYTAVEQEPDSWETGFALARYLWQNHCWRASLRECWRLLATHPQEHKTYGLVYRNLLCMGQEDNARFAYERYMVHLYHNPDDGLNLGEDDPPIPPPPPKKRYRHLLHHASRKLEAGKLQRANRLLKQAGHPTFPDKSPERDLLHAKLMVEHQLYNEAQAFIEGLIAEGDLSANDALSLLPIQEEIFKAQGAKDEDTIASFGNLIHYAILRAENPVQLSEVTNLMLQMETTGMWLEQLEVMLEKEPYRADLLYHMSVCCLYEDDPEGAMDYLELCYDLDPFDTDTAYLYHMLEEQLEDEDYQGDKQALPISLPYTPFSMNRLASHVELDQMLQALSPKEAAAKFANQPEQNMLMDGLYQMPPSTMELVLDAVSTMEAKEQEVLLRRMLLSGSFSRRDVVPVLDMLAVLGVTGDVPVMENHLLKMRQI